MKNTFLLAGTVLMLLTGAGCSQSTEPMSKAKSDELDKALDSVLNTDDKGSFAKKQECAKYLAPYLKKWNEGGIPGILYLRPEVCYDTTLDTCILMEKMNYSSGDQDLEATDLFTNRSIYERTVPKGERVDGSAELKEHVHCAE